MSNKLTIIIFILGVMQGYLMSSLTQKGQPVTIDIVALKNSYMADMRVLDEARKEAESKKEKITETATELEALVESCIKALPDEQSQEFYDKYVALPTIHRLNEAEN